MADLLPLFLNLTGRGVLLVGGGPVAAAKLTQLVAAGARIRVVAPDIRQEIVDRARGVQPGDGEADWTAPQITLIQRPFEPSDLDGVWLVVAAATPEVNRQVAEVAETLRVFVNAVDDPANASAFLSGVVRRDGVTLAISTSGQAPALTALLREGLDLLLPGDLASWLEQARAERVVWRREGVPMEARKPRLLRALNDLYDRPEGLHYERAERLHDERGERLHDERGETRVVQDVSPASEPRPAGVTEAARVPWLSGPEDSWL